MSSLFKAGFQQFNNSNEKPYILDVSKKDITSSSKVIRPLEEKSEDSTEQQNEKTVNGSEMILDDAMDNARIIREDAVKRAAQIISDAEAEAVSIRENAMKEGYEKGLSDGQMEAMKRADEYLNNIRDEQDMIKRQIEEENLEKLYSFEESVVDVSCELIKKLTGIVVDDYKEVMLHIINNAISNADASRHFVISVSEGNYAYVLDNKDRIVNAGNPNISLEIFSDAKLDNRGCLIETDNGIIDASMDIQVNNLITAIKMLSE